MHCARTVQKFTRQSIETKFRIRAYTFGVDPSAEFLSELGTIQFMLFSSLCPTYIWIRPRCHHGMCMHVLYIIVAIRNVTHNTPCKKRCAIENLIVCHTATFSGPPRNGTAIQYGIITCFDQHGYLGLEFLFPHYGTSIIHNDISSSRPLCVPVLWLIFIPITWNICTHVELYGLSIFRPGYCFFVHHII